MVFLCHAKTKKNHCFVDVLDRYMALFDSRNKTGRFFRKIGKNGPTDRNIGVYSIGKFPKKIAEYLQLDPTDYTGHCYRRSSATIGADSGLGLVGLKRLGRWKSDSVAFGYVEESKKSKIDIGNIFADGGGNFRENETQFNEIVAVNDQDQGIITSGEISYGYVDQKAENELLEKNKSRLQQFENCSFNGCTFNFK